VCVVSEHKKFMLKNVKYISDLKYRYLCFLA